MNTAEAQARIISKFLGKAERVDRSLYELSNGCYVLFRTSIAHKVGNKYLYWFGFDKYRLEVDDQSKLYIAYVCGSENQTVVVPAREMLKILDGVETVADNNWKIKIYDNAGKFELVVTGKPYFDVTANLNRFEIIAPVLNDKTNDVQSLEHSQPKESETEFSIEDQINGLDGVAGNSLHNRLIDMLQQIGGWMGYKAHSEYAIRPDVPYRLDVAWIQNDSIHVAIEVQISGNETEAKDRLILARRFGARKLIIVSSPESVDRIKSIFRYETDVKHWLEIWGVESVYNMFLDGRNFFETYNKFNKHEYRDDVTEMVSVAQ